MDAPPPSFPVATAAPLMCLRCNTALDFAGIKWFQEGGIAGEIGSLFSNCDRLDVRVCPKCGRLEFFVGAVGDSARSASLVHEPLRPATSAEALLREGGVLAARGEVEAAVACFEQVTVKYPGTNYARDAEQNIRELREKLGM